MDTLHLASQQGVVDRLLQQCHDLGAPITAIRRAGQSVVVEVDGPLRSLAALRTFSSAGVLLGDYETLRKNNYADVVDQLRTSLKTGLLSALPTADLSFRVDPFGDRWEFRDVLVEQLGWRNDPSSWDVNFTRFGPLLVAQVGALYHSTRFRALERIPASTNPLVATVLVQLAKLKPQQVVLDPFCGAGTNLVEALTEVPDIKAVGSDLSSMALSRARLNLPGVTLLRSDAARLPLADQSVDAVISNIPFGKRVGSHRGNQQLYPAMLGEISRTLKVSGRVVLLTEDKRLLVDSVQRTHGLRIIKEAEFETGGLHPSAYVIERTVSARRSQKAKQRRAR